MTKEGKEYLRGFLDGLEAFAHMKDGTTYIGTCGTKLKDAKAQPEKIWNYNP